MPAKDVHQQSTYGKINSNPFSVPSKWLFKDYLE